MEGNRGVVLVIVLLIAIGAVIGSYFLFSGGEMSEAKKVVRDYEYEKHLSSCSQFENDVIKCKDYAICVTSIIVEHLTNEEILEVKSSMDNVEAVVEIYSSIEEDRRALMDETILSCVEMAPGMTRAFENING